MGAFSVWHVVIVLVVVAILFGIGRMRRAATPAWVADTAAPAEHGAGRASLRGLLDGLALLLLLAMLGLALAAFVARYGFASPFDGYTASGLLAMALGGVAIALASFRGRHVRSDIVLPWPGARPVGELVMAAVAAALAICALEQVSFALSIAETTAESGLPIWPAFAVAVGGIGLAALGHVGRLPAPPDAADDAPEDDVS